MSTRSRPRRLVGQTTINVVLLVVGVNFLLWPDRATSGSYAVAYDVADSLPGGWSPQTKWGFAFIVCALTAMIVPRLTTGVVSVLAAAVPIFWMAWWVLLLGLAIYVDKAQSMNGPAVWGGLAIVYTWSLAEYGSPAKVRWRR